VRAIDLYAGVGGWSLGLRLAGIEVVASYEWWDRAVETHNRNHGGGAKPVDIRTMDRASLPRDIDLVVGSPPCTEFSYSNRGGNGNLEEGLKDLVRFFEVVECLKPRWWVMENVPRVAEVLRHGFDTIGHPLHRFRHLRSDINIFDMSDFGVPQARKRCIAGNIRFDLLQSYSAVVGRRTLGDVVAAFSTDIVVDPVWGVELSRNQLTEMETEAPLNAEELRMNREAKLYHPVYNNMSFPDDFEAPARTVTATCTRVSRESIVIADPLREGSFRRLTIRERATLQGFPITYQFYGQRFGEKAKMAGNAIPPPFTYLVACAVQGTPATRLRTFEEAGGDLRLPDTLPLPTTPDEEGRTFPEKRRFRAALPYLRFKSGMRFDLSNQFEPRGPVWKVRFYFGPSKDVRQVDMDDALGRDLQRSPLVATVVSELAPAFERASNVIRRSTPVLLQRAWTKRVAGVGPFEITDALGTLADEVYGRLVAAAAEDQTVEAFVVSVAATDETSADLPSVPKLKRNALRILSGLIVGCWFNAEFEREPERVAA